MTHYMELLATNQPWNLIIFMAIPVILAEIVAITELFILFDKKTEGSLRKVNKIAGIIGGIYFTGVFLYLFSTVVIPLTTSNGWRGIADITAVGFYLLGVFPLGGIALLELNLIGKTLSKEAKMKKHAIFVAIFLIVAHVAMIMGMVDPEILGWKSQVPAQMEMNMSNM